MRYQRVIGRLRSGAFLRFDKFEALEHHLLNLEAIVMLSQDSPSLQEEVPLLELRRLPGLRELIVFYPSRLLLGALPAACARSGNGEVLTPFCC
jgi:hypothetical protein